ncbi:MAG: hypothetical protein K2X91_09455 [Thermoleophilia bacterium]|nr:hypothetical protein [Thermoleophilia bacterium]
MSSRKLGVIEPAGEVDVPHRLLGQPGPEHLVVGVAEADAEEHPVQAPLLQALGAGDHQRSDAIERIALAPGVAEPDFRSS